MSNPQPIASRLVRSKAPEHDLKRTYARTLRLSAILACVLHVGVAVAFPSLRAQVKTINRQAVVIETLDIPETRQIQRPPPPPRPAVPVATESNDVPEDVTIEVTDLDFENVPVDLPPPPSAEATEEIVEEEVLEFFMVEQKPEIVKQVPPTYPEVARKAGIQGSVILKVLVGKGGQVEQALVLKGKDILQNAALEAVYQYRFKPALQNDKPVKVWLTMPIRFQLVG